MNEETFKDEKGTFHYEPVVWGDWKVGDEIIFEGYNTVDEAATGGYEYTVGDTYLIGEDGVCDVGPIDDNDLWACPECFSSAFKFSRKIYDKVDVVEIENKEQKDSIKQEKSLDNLLKELHNLKQEEKELSAKIDNVLKEINSVVGLYGLSVLFKNEHDVLQEND